MESASATIRRFHIGLGFAGVSPRRSEAAARRLDELNGIPILELNEKARELARRFIEQGVIPAQAVEDAFHVAIATAQGLDCLDYLLTWNCRHIANAEIVGRLATICDELGFEMPTICTPEQLMGD